MLELKGVKYPKSVPEPTLSHTITAEIVKKKTRFLYSFCIFAIDNRGFVVYHESSD